MKQMLAGLVAAGACAAALAAFAQPKDFPARPVRVVVPVPPGVVST